MNLNRDLQRPDCLCWWPSSLFQPFFLRLTFVRLNNKDLPCKLIGSYEAQSFVFPSVNFLLSLFQLLLLLLQLLLLHLLLSHNSPPLCHFTAQQNLRLCTSPAKYLSTKLARQTCCQQPNIIFVIFAPRKIWVNFCTTQNSVNRDQMSCGAMTNSSTQRYSVLLFGLKVVTFSNFFHMKNFLNEQCPQRLRQNMMNIA